LRFGCIAGALQGHATPQQYKALDDYGRALGEAFQIADDLLDVEGDAAEVGKDVGRDTDAGKATFVSILGLERARSQAVLLADQAAAHLDTFGDKAEMLRQVARFVVTRRH
jgi:farnesyl diphosphate synthase